MHLQGALVKWLLYVIFGIATDDVLDILQAEAHSLYQPRYSLILFLLFLPLMPNDATAALGLGNRAHAAGLHTTIKRIIFVMGKYTK